MVAVGTTLRITFVSASLRRGGAERVISTLASDLVSRHEVTLVTLEGATEGEYTLDGRVTRIALGVSGHSNGVLEAVRANVRRLASLRRAIRGSRPDVVVSFIHRMNVMTLLACFGTRIPVIISERSDPRMAPLGRAWRVLRWLVYRTADVVVCQTGSAARWMHRLVAKRRVAVIANPVRLVALGSAPHREGSAPTIVGMGRLSVEKGFDLLIRAFARTTARHTYELLLVGDGRERDHLEELARSLGVGDRVRFPGQVDDPDQWLAPAEIFVLSSRFEGFPNVLLEAMALGRCVVAFDCQSGPADIVTDGKDGLLVPGGDVAALAVAIDRVAADERLRRSLGTAALGVRTRYALPAIAASWEAQMRAVSRRAAPGSPVR